MVSRIVVGMEVLCMRPTRGGSLIEGGFYKVKQVKNKFFAPEDGVMFHETGDHVYLPNRFMSWPDEIELLARTERAVEHHKMFTKQGRGGGTNPGSVTLTYGADGQWLITNTSTS